MSVQLSIVAESNNVTMDMAMLSNLQNNIVMLSKMFIISINKNLFET